MQSNHILKLLAIVFVSIGCSPEENTDSERARTSVPGEVNETDSQPTESATHTEETLLKPQYAAELFIESRDEEAGTVRYTGTILSESHSKSTTTLDGNQSSSSRWWKSSKTKMKFTMADKTECVLVPRFLESKEGSDIWEVTNIELRNSELPDEQESLATRIISFDGNTEIRIADRPDLLVVFRKNSFTQEAQNESAPRIMKDSER